MTYTKKAVLIVGLTTCMIPFLSYAQNTPSHIKFADGTAGCTYENGWGEPYYKAKCTLNVYASTKLGTKPDYSVTKDVLLGIDNGYGNIASPPSDSQVEKTVCAAYDADVLKKLGLPIKDMHLVKYSIKIPSLRAGIKTLAGTCK